MASSFVLNAGFWWGVWSIHKKELLLLMGLILNAAFEVALFSLLTNKVTSSQERMFALLRTINNRFELIVMSVALFFFLASWIEVVFSEVLQKDKIGNFLQMVCFVGAGGTLLSGIIIMALNVARYFQSNLVFYDYGTLAYSSLLVFLTLCLLACVGAIIVFIGKKGMRNSHGTILKMFWICFLLLFFLSLVRYSSSPSPFIH